MEIANDIKNYDFQVSYDFIILSDAEEEALSLNERLIYYEELKKYYLTEEYIKQCGKEKKKPLVLSDAEAVQLREEYMKHPYKISSVEWRRKLHPTLLDAMDSKVKHEIILLNDLELPLGKKVLFCANHSNKHDVPVLCSAIKEHAYILAGDEPKYSVDGLAFWANGVAWANRGKKASKNEAKDEFIADILHGVHGILFPEATWNSSENEIIYPLHWGCVDISRITDAPIIPVAMEYIGKKCYIMFGAPISIKEGETKENAVNRVRDAMATLKFYIWEKFSVSKRNLTDRNMFQNEFQKRLDEYPKLDYVAEQSYRYKPDKFHEEWSTIHLPENIHNKRSKSVLNIINFRPKVKRKTLENPNIRYIA